MDKNLEYPQVCSWLEINSSALKNNIAAFRKIVSPASQLGVVLKGNAYGHGLFEVFSAIATQVDIVYLISAQDAFALRDFAKKQGIPKTRLLVMGALSPREVLECVKQDIEVVIYSENFFESIALLKKEKPAQKALCHIHVDTGLGREGIFHSDILAHTAFLKENLDVVQIKGMMSHFSNTEDVTEQSYALSQIDIFTQCCNKIAQQFALASEDLERHFAASTATLVLPQARFHTVRVGISLYGLWPSPETKISAKLTLPELPLLKPALSWKCRSQQLKWLPKDSFISYGCTYQTMRNTLMALLPVGYFDGYTRFVSGRAHVLVNGHRCPVLGRVMMNHIIVDITDAEVLQGETSVVATLLGSDGKETISADQIANWAQTINYEIVTRIGPHLQRIVTS